MEGFQGGGDLKAMWRVGIVGCGRIAGLKDVPRSQGPVETHAQAYHRHPAFQLVAAADPSAERRHLFQKTWKVPLICSSLEEMLTRERLDAVSLCSPMELHFVQARWILSAGAPPQVLLMEKPVCLFPEELNRLRNLEGRTGIRIAVNHTRRFDPEYRRLAELTRMGQLGSLIEGKGTYYGGWFNGGSHLVDTLRMLLHAEPKVLQASVCPGGRGEDHNLNVLLSADGAEIRMEGFQETYFQRFEADLCYESGRVRLMDLGTQIVMERVKVNPLGERVLVPLDGFPRNASDGPLANAVEAMEAELQGKPIFRRMGVDLDSAAPSMDLLWRAQELAGIDGARLAAETLHATSP